MSVFATVVVAFIGFCVLLAVIVALAVPVTERAERHGKHSGWYR